LEGGATIANSEASNPLGKAELENIGITVDTVRNRLNDYYNSPDVAQALKNSLEALPNARDDPVSLNVRENWTPGKRLKANMEAWARYRRDGAFPDIQFGRQKVRSSCL